LTSIDVLLDRYGRKSVIVPATLMVVGSIALGLATDFVGADATLAATALL
jgi:MFS family permease